MLLFVVHNVEHLTGVVLWCETELVTQLDHTLLNLTKDHGSVTILHFVEDRNSEGSRSISLIDWHVVENVEKSWSAVPTADIG